MSDSTFKELPKIGKFIKRERRIEVIRDKRGGMGSYCLMGTWFVFGV